MSKARARGRPRGSPANHHLFLEDGVWIFRWARNGRDVRRSTGYPKAEVARARVLRDKWIAERTDKRNSIETIPRAVTIGELVRLYLEAESNPYDFEKGGEQPGTKRDATSDRVIVARLRKAGLDFGLAADLLDKERLLAVAAKMRHRAPLTRRNTFRLLRRVYGWGRARKRQTGVLLNPFDDFDKTDPERGDLFSNKVKAKAPPFRPEELRALYEKLPAHVYRPVRFAAHTGMRWQSEVLRMTWGSVDFERRVCTTTPYAKRGKERDVPLGDVALSIPEQIRPGSPSPDAPVWLNSRDNPLRDVRDSYERAVGKVCPDPRPGWRRPDFHSLRRTCASALAQIVPTAVVGAVLGHAKETVTDSYITVPLDAQIAAVNGAAKLIDGGNVVLLASRRKMAEKMGVA
jgi:integrase